MLGHGRTCVSLPSAFLLSTCHFPADLALGTLLKAVNRDDSDVGDELDRFIGAASISAKHVF